MTTSVRIANAPCSWGAFELAGHPDVPWQDVLGEMRESGYTGTELGDWGYLPTDPMQLRAALERFDLELVAAFVPVHFSQPDRQKEGLELASKTAQLLQAVSPKAWLVLSDDNCADPVRAQFAGKIQAVHGLTDAQWTAYAQAVEKVARHVLERCGIRSVFHHHGGGFVETPDEFATLLAKTDPDLIGICLDTGHLMFGGGDPAELVRRYGRRIRHVHFKDFDPSVVASSKGYVDAVGRRVFCRLGAGEVDFGAVKGALDDIGYDGWIVVEQDILQEQGSPMEAAFSNRSFIRSLGW